MGYKLGHATIVGEVAALLVRVTAPSAKCDQQSSIELRRHARHAADQQARINALLFETIDALAALLGARHP